MSFLQLVSIVASTCFMRFCCFFQKAIGYPCSNPDINAVSSGVTSIRQRKAIKRIKGGNTIFGKRNAWEIVCDEPLPKSAKAEVQGMLQQ